MAHFFVRLTPKRPDFPANITDDERAIMARHSAFLADQLARGALVVAGPVVSSAGTFGMAVFEADSKDAVTTLLSDDPASELGSYEVMAMLQAVARPRPGP